MQHVQLFLVNLAMYDCALHASKYCCARVLFLLPLFKHVVLTGVSLLVIRHGEIPQQGPRPPTIEEEEGGGDRNGVLVTHPLHSAYRHTITIHLFTSKHIVSFSSRRPPSYTEKLSKMPRYTTTKHWMKQTGLGGSCSQRRLR